MTEYGTCAKHGQFILTEGCPECLAEKHQDFRTPEPLSEEARAILTGGRDEMIKHATSPVPETAVALRPSEDIEAHGYFEEGMRCLEYAEARHIVNFEDMAKATEDLSLISKLKKVMENKRTSLLEPLKFQADAIRATYDYLMMPVLQAGRLTRDQMLSFNQKQDRIRREQEAVNQLRMEAAQRDAALHNGEISEPVNLVEVIEPPPEHIRTEVGMSSTIKKWEFEVVDFSSLPDQYKLPDMVKIRKVITAGATIPGVKAWQETNIRVKPA